ncbi:hypothetical protein LTR36_004547 [Oleoguttula mirabilis]|uniref:Uncharacterized protein n=1 Tax=Oleoguttula mirabilis TaxID=1507867 RepID=A0AAV9JGV1_9PEZI|nr:hypothetical protein LTR36_004547 [Oleoguttula mirabilis]
MRLDTLTLLAALTPYALGYPKFTTPAAGASVAAGTISVAWENSGSPAISTLSTYTLTLIVGGNDAATQLPLTAIEADGDFTTGNTASGAVTAGLAGSTTNGFFLKMVSVSSDGGTITTYSDRFTMTGMTGTTAATYLTAVTALDGATAGPALVDDVSTDTATTAAAAAADEYTVPYNLQTGLTKYAPMQPIPGTKITAKTYSAMYPTSAYTVATTYLAAASIVITVTESQTFSASSMENTAAAVANPTDDGSDMSKFLRRWKD